MLRRIGFLLFLLLFVLRSFAQVNNTGLDQEIKLSDSTTHEIGLQIYDASFLRNNEYMHDIATGYTLFGQQLSTSLYYQMHHNWKVLGGIYLRRDFGAKGILNLQPCISMKFQQQGYSFLFGNLEGQLAHRLSEPIFNYERYMTDFNETGLQFKINHRKLWSDTWINWEVMQYNRSDYQEEFVAGHHTQYHVLSTPKHDMMLDLQGLVHHKGGQIDVDTHKVRTRFNAGLGLHYARLLNRWVTRIEWAQSIFFYNEAAPPAGIAIDHGMGFYSQMSVNAKPGFVLSVQYWKSENYLATHGGYLFQSESSEFLQKSATQKQRELLFFRLLYQKEILRDIYMDIRFEPYYDLANQYLEYGYAFYLNYKKDFTIGKLKIRQLK